MKYDFIPDSFYCILPQFLALLCFSFGVVTVNYIYHDHITIRWLGDKALTMKIDDEDIFKKIPQNY